MTDTAGSSIGIADGPTVCVDEIIVVDVCRADTDYLSHADTEVRG